MDRKIVIELNNGQHVEGSLARRFVPAEKEVSILLADSKEKRLFSLSRVSCILLSEPLPEMLPQPDDLLEVVECVNKGRIAIHELLLCDGLVKETIKSRGSVTEIQKAGVEEGMRTLRMDGVAKVLAGVTDMEQIQKVCL